MEIRKAEAQRGGRASARSLPRRQRRPAVLPGASRLVCTQDSSRPRGATAAEALGGPTAPLRLAPGPAPKPGPRPAEAPGPRGSARPLPASSASRRAGRRGRRRGRARPHGGLPAPPQARGPRAGRAEGTRGGNARPGSPAARTLCLPRGLRGLFVPELCSAGGWDSRLGAVGALLRPGGRPLPAYALVSGPADSLPTRSIVKVR